MNKIFVSISTWLVLVFSTQLTFAATTSPYPSVPLYLNQPTVKPNVAVFIDDSGSMNNSLPNKAGKKIDVAKTALTKLFKDNWSIASWSLFHFKYGSYQTSEMLAGWSDASTTSVDSSFTTAIKNISPNGSTPSAGAFYNITKSFAGDYAYDVPACTHYQWQWVWVWGWGWQQQQVCDAWGVPSTTYISPIQYICQKNYVIFISDGEPNSETVDGSGITRAGKSIGINNDYTMASLSSLPFPRPSNSNDTDPLVIKYADFYYQNGIVPLADRDAKKYASVDSEGNAYDRSKIPALQTYAIGFGLDPASDGQTILNDVALVGGTTTALNASDPDSLNTALSGIVASIKAINATNVPVVTSQPTNPKEAFQATFYSGDWSGQIKAYKTKSNGLVDLTSSIPVVFNTTSATSRADNIFSSSKAVAGGAQFKTMANTITYSVTGSSTDLMNYLANTSTPTGWRDRSGDKSSPATLGDIIDSTPMPFGLSSPTDFAAGFAVGANDGMLHVFSRQTSSGTVSYTENFSYVPRAVQPNLMSLGKKTYGKADPHLYFVNGALTFNNAIGGDTQFDAGIYSILTGSLAQGGQGIFALDISQPVASKSFSSAGVLWDHTSADTDFTNLGYTFSNPVVAQVYVGGQKKWAVITGNGYDSTNKKTSLMVIDLKTGTMLYEIDTGVASNGLSSPVVLDKDKDKVTDYVYAGDQFGNVWRFKLPTKTDSTTSVTKFFTTQGNQPVTSAPAIYAVPAGGYIVYVGTGRMMYENTTVNDRTTTYPQSLYGIYDDLTKSNLTYSSTTFIQNGEISTKTGDTASIDGSATSSSGSNKGASVDFRETTPITLTDSIGPGGTKSGWVFNMNATNGERMIYQPIVALGRLYFTTQVLKGTDKVCSNVNQQSGWAMALDLMTGGAPSSSAFDLNGDGKLNSSAMSPDGDVVKFSDSKNAIAPAGIDYHIGIPSALAVTFTHTQVNLGDYLRSDSGQLGSYPYPSSPSSNEVLNFHVGGTGGTNGNAAAGKLLPGAVAGGGRRIAWRELF